MRKPLPISPHGTCAACSDKAGIIMHGNLLLCKPCARGVKVPLHVVHLDWLKPEGFALAAARKPIQPEVKLPKAARKPRVATAPRAAWMRELEG